MPVIINDLEIVAEPAAGSGTGDTQPASSQEEVSAPSETSLSPFIVREILERASERGLRTFAH